MSRQVTPQPGEMPRAFAERMAEALSALLGSELAVREADRSADADWLLEAVDETTPPRRVVVGVAAADASAIAGRVRGGAVADDQVESVLSQVWSACLERFGGDGQALWTGRVARAEGSPGAWSAAYRLDGPEGLGVTAMFAVESGQTEDVGPHGSPAKEATRSAPPSNLDVILDIDLPLAVRFGGTDMTIDALTRLGPGALIDLGRSPDEPVDVLVNGRMVARGEVVVVGGNYGVRVTEVVSAADRLRSMGM